PVGSSIIHTNTNDDEAECRTTTSSEDFSDDESDGSDNIDSRNINQTNPKSRTNDKSAEYVVRIWQCSYENSKA
ncbi:unnamed protein product, partial [Rotaria magnacalcarata]